MHFDLPFRVLADGSFATVEQDSDADVTACIRAILLSRIGYRDDRPEIGMPDPAHRQGGLDLQVAQSIVEQFEPRSDRVLKRDPALLASIVDEITVQRPA